MMMTIIDNYYDCRAYLQLRDMISFMLIMAVFISAYGVVSNIILYPNQPLNATLLHDVFYDAWWSVIQQFNREDALGKLFIIPESPSNKIAHLNKFK